MGKVNVLFKSNQKILNIGSSLKKIISFCCKMILTLEKFKKPAEISIFFTDNSNIEKLNFKYKNKNCPTDVLSFSTKSFGKYFEYDGVVVLGDIVISCEKALKQFKLYNSISLEEEILRLIVHSVLHLLGYDHEKSEREENIMKNKEKILNKIVRCKLKIEKGSAYEQKL